MNILKSFDLGDSKLKLFSVSNTITEKHLHLTKKQKQVYCGWHNNVLFLLGLAVFHNVRELINFGRGYVFLFKL
jgi:hypothetical protein